MGHTTAFDEFKQGVNLLRNQCPAQALEHIRKAVEQEAENPYYLSYFGLATGMARRQWADAEQLCEKALKLKRNQPQLYLNLAEVYRRSGRRGDAADTLRTGLLYTGRAAILEQALGKLRRRRSPTLPFLGRGHKLNRSLGRVRERLAQIWGTEEKA
jgi:Flp pilus assembly protein TadD